MKAGSIRSKGIALAITMLVLTVLTIISLAFFKAYKSHFSLTRGSRASETAQMACDSVYDYIAYRLEHDRDWGSAEFTDVDREKDPASDLVVLNSLIGTHQFEGEIPGTGATLNGRIYNNLAGVHPDDGLFPARGTARCEVVCKSGDSTRRVEFLVRVAPLFDSSALTRANLKVDAETLTMRSRDTNRNMLRSEQDIFVPDMLTGERTKFYLPDSDSPDNNGLLWAKGDIHSYDGFGGSVALEDPEDFATASESSHGKLVSGADSHFSIFDLDKELIKIPDSQVPITGVQPGRWTFSRRLADVNYTAPYRMVDDDEEFNSVTATTQIWVDVLEYYSDPDATSPTKVYRAADRTEDIAAQIPPEITERDWDEDTGYLVPNDIVTNGMDVHIPGYSGDVEILGSNSLAYTNEDASFTFDLQNQRVTASSNALIDVSGPFHVTSETDPNCPTETPPPVLDLGYETSDTVDGGVAKAVIRAVGDISIKNGVTEGLGALISNEGDVAIQPKNTNTVTVDSSLAGSGLLVFAGGNVELSNPVETENWTFKGLVYARGGILMKGNGAGNATFEGSIVALQENPAEVGDPDGIEFRDCADIEFIYSSKMLEAYVSQLQGERIQVETVYWRD